MFAENGTQGNIMMRSQDIFHRLRTALNDAADFYAWLSAQTDADLGEGGTVNFKPQDLQFLRGAYADVMAWRAIGQNQLPPPTYPQPASAYPYFANVTQVIGPA